MSYFKPKQATQKKKTYTEDNSDDDDFVISDSDSDASFEPKAKTKKKQLMPLKEDKFATMFKKSKKITSDDEDYVID